MSAAVNLTFGSMVRTKFPDSEIGEVVDFDPYGEPIVRLPVPDSSRGYEDVNIPVDDLDVVDHPGNGERA